MIGISKTGRATSRLAAIVLVSLVGTAVPVIAQDKAERVLSIGGAVTEIIYALGEEYRLIGRDSTSSYPETATALPDVGYMRALAPEGVLSIKPDLILAREGSGPPEAIEVIRSAGIPFVDVPEQFTAEGIGDAVDAVADALGVEDKGDVLHAEISAQMEQLAETVAGIGEKKRVLFILSMQGGRIMASGTGTAANGIIELAGAENAIADFQGYKQLTDEAIISVDPDAILMMERDGELDTPPETVLAHPAVATTQAGKNKALIRMNGLYLLGFGPRTASAALDLAKALYGDDIH